MREKLASPSSLVLSFIKVTKTDLSEHSKLSIIRQPHGVGEEGIVQGRRSRGRR